MIAARSYCFVATVAKIWRNDIIYVKTVHLDSVADPIMPRVNATLSVP